MFAVAPQVMRFMYRYAHRLASESEDGDDVEEELRNGEDNDSDVYQWLKCVVVVVL